jgi:hypothetical protein
VPISARSRTVSVGMALSSRRHSAAVHLSLVVVTTTGTAVVAALALFRGFASVGGRT